MIQRKGGFDPARPVFGLLLLTAIVALALNPGSQSVALAQTNPSDWPQYLDGPSHSSYNAAATSITVPGIQAGDLQPVWRWTVPASTNSGENILLASPTVVGGVVYIGAEDGMFYAVSEATQTVLWSDFLGLDTAKGSCGGEAQGIISTAAVITDPNTGNLTVYVFGPNGTLYALNAATGATVWTAQVDTPSTTVNDYYSWGSPLVVNSEVYIGISSECDDPLVPAGLVEFNQSTGAQVAIWDSLAPGGLGGSIWSSAAALPDGSIIATTGNGYESSGQPPYDESIVHLNASTLGLLDAWSVPPDQQVADADFGASPTLFSADIDGTSTPMVGACNKNGVYYAFKQADLSGGPLWQTSITIPYPGSSEECDSAAIWNGSSLIEGGGAPTTIDGTNYLGSVQALNPATGTPLWQTGIPGFVIGSPTEDGAGVIAAPVYQAGTEADMGVYLLNASNGQVIGMIQTPTARIFGQPVFAGSDLLVAAKDTITAYEITTAGPAITSVSPSTVEINTNHSITLTGSGFSGTPRVFVSGGMVNVTADTVLSPTSLSVTLSAGEQALPGLRSITVIEPGSPQRIASSCQNCLSITAPTTTTLTSSLDPTSYGQPVTFTATVANGSSSSPTGTVSFGYYEGATLGTGTLNSSGIATFTTSTLPAGANTIVGVYGGDSNNPGSTSNTFTQAINPALTSTSLVSSLNPSAYGQPVTFTATVTDASGGGIPSGTVNFYNGTSFLGTGKLNHSGTATFTISTLPAGADQISAIYGGGGNQAGSPAGPLQGVPSTSNTVTQTIDPAVPTATGLSPASGPVGSSAEIVAQGFAASSALTVTVDGIAATVTAGATTDASGSATVTFTIPAVPHGPQSVVVTDASSDSATSATNFIVTGSATLLNPINGSVGTIGVTILAQGFAASSALTVQVDGSAATITSGGTTGSNGSSTVTFTIPAMPNGQQKVLVKDASSNTATSATDFTVIAATSGLSPSSGAVGSSAQITAKGFAAGSGLTVTVDGITATITAGATSDTKGSSKVTFTIPALPNGSYSVVVTDASFNAATSATNFTVT